MEKRIKTIQASELFPVNTSISGTVDIPEPEPVDDAKIAEEIEIYRKYKAQVCQPENTFFIPPSTVLPSSSPSFSVKKEDSFLMKVKKSITSFFEARGEHFEQTPRDNYKK